MSKENTPTSTPFNQKIAKIVKFILDSQTSDSPATRKDIAMFIEETEASVGTILDRLESDSEAFLEKEKLPTEGKGRPRYQYKLIRRKIVTHPLTAWISLELHRSTQIENEIDREIFEKSIIDKLKQLNYKSEQPNLESFVKSKISALIAIGNIVAADPPQTTVYLDDTKFNRQRAYLELLAKDLKIELNTD